MEGFMVEILKAVVSEKAMNILMECLMFIGAWAVLMGLMILLHFVADIPVVALVNMVIGIFIRKKQIVDSAKKRTCAIAQVRFFI